MAKEKNTAASPMTYEVTRMPNIRSQAARAAHAGEDEVKIEAAEPQAVKLTTDKKGK
jgi:hypothetical protein